MLIRTKVSETLDGTSGGTLSVKPEFKTMQISITGRTSGTITVTAKSLGGQAAEAFQPALTINLANEYTAIVEGYALESLTFVPSASGADFDVSIYQWSVD